MNPDLFFNMANGLATLGWALLLFTPHWHVTRKLLYSLLLPAILCLAYLVGMLIYPADGGMDFSSLSSVTSMFAQPGVVLIGWIHYLAFDLMVGLWISSNARQHGIRHVYLILPLILTFMLGPIGLLTYLLLRSILLRSLDTSNFDQVSA